MPVTVNISGYFKESARRGQTEVNILQSIVTFCKKKKKKNPYEMICDLNTLT